MFFSTGFITIGNDVLGSIRISNAHIEGHTAGNGAGGFMAVGGSVQGVVEINSSRICNCQAKTSGGALYVQSGVFGGIFLGAGATLCGNKAVTGSGGAIAGGFTVPVVAVSDGAQLLENEAEVDGGAVWSSGLIGNITISAGGRVAANRAAGNGAWLGGGNEWGGACARGGMFKEAAGCWGHWKDWELACINGHALAVVSLVRAHMWCALRHTGGAFAAGFIGGVELRDGGEAVGNTAGVDGGLAWADRLTSFWLRGGSATSNTAGNSGSTAVSFIDSLLATMVKTAAQKQAAFAFGLPGAKKPRLLLHGPCTAELLFRGHFLHAHALTSLPLPCPPLRSLPPSPPVPSPPLRRRRASCQHAPGLRGTRWGCALRQPSQARYEAPCGGTKLNDRGCIVVTSLSAYH